jgi:Putative zinc-finger
VSDFNSISNAGPVQPLSCERCEELLADALDGVLTGANQASFDRHIRECEVCSTMMADAQRGAAWLEMLRLPRPEPSAALLDRILAQTSGQASASIEVPKPVLVASPNVVPVHTSNVLPFRSRVASTLRTGGIMHILREPRLAMTAAMAFFSVALTLSMTGVQITDIRLSQLSPLNLERAFFSANAAVVRYYDNLSVVAEVQSRVHDLQSDSSSDTDVAPQLPAAPAAQPNATPAEPKGDQQPAQKQPNPGSGTSRREVPNADSTQTRSKFVSRAKHEAADTTLLSEVLPSQLFPTPQGFSPVKKDQA